MNKSVASITYTYISLPHIQQRFWMSFAFAIAYLIDTPSATPGGVDSAAANTSNGTCPRRGSIKARCAQPTFWIPCELLIPLGRIWGADEKFSRGIVLGGSGRPSPEWGPGI